MSKFLREQKKFDYELEDLNLKLNSQSCSVEQKIAIYVEMKKLISRRMSDLSYDRAVKPFFRSKYFAELQELYQQVDKAIKFLKKVVEHFDNFLNKS